MRKQASVYKSVSDYVQELKRIRNPDKLIKIFKSVPNNLKGEVILSLSKRKGTMLINALKDDEILTISHYLSPDEVTDLLQLISNRDRRSKLLKRLGRDIREKVDFLLKFDPRTAAGMMSLDYVEVTPETTFDELAKITKRHEKRTGKIPVILVVKDGYLIGELPIHELVLHKGKERVGPYVHRVPVIRYDSDEDAVINTFRKHKHNKIVVLDDDESILGVIYSDDILRLIGERTTQDLYQFAGVSEEEDVFDPFITKVRHRYNWLVINLMTEFLAASVVSLFQKTIQAYVFLAVYMPIVAGMGGNAGTQTLAVIVRGLALNKIDRTRAKSILINEVLAGIVNGVITGSLVALVAWLLNGNPVLGLVIALAMVINLMIAGFFGTLIPLVLKRLGKDPASSATIFITTATDVCGFLSFLGLASVLL